MKIQKTQIEAKYEETVLALAHVLKEQARARQCSEEANLDHLRAEQNATAARRALDRAKDWERAADAVVAEAVTARQKATDEYFTAELSAGVKPTVVDSDGIARDLPSPSHPEHPNERRMFTFRITACEPGIEDYSKWFRHLGLPLRGWSFGELALRLHSESVVVNSCPTWAYVRTPIGNYELEAVV